MPIWWFLICTLTTFGPAIAADKKWDGLVVTFELPGLFKNPLAFNALPRKVVDAVQQNWTQLDDGCSNSKLHFVGHRYILGHDLSVFILFDKNGYVAGIQYSIPKDETDKNSVVDYGSRPEAVLQNVLGKDVYVFTVYFVDPKEVCSKGRTEAEFEVQGTGTALSIQNGTDPVKDSVLVPTTDQPRLMESMDWTLGYCFPNMGQHYNKGLHRDTECSQMSPNFLLYDPEDNHNVGFGFYTFGRCDNPRCESLPKEVLPIFTPAAPDCLRGALDGKGVMTSLHVYTTAKPRDMNCPPGTTYASE